MSVHESIAAALYEWDVEDLDGVPRWPQVSQYEREHYLEQAAVAMDAARAAVEDMDDWFIDLPSQDMALNRKAVLDLLTPATPLEVEK